MLTFLREKGPALPQKRGKGTQILQKGDFTKGRRKLQRREKKAIATGGDWSITRIETHCPPDPWEKKKHHRDMGVK